MATKTATFPQLDPRKAIDSLGSRARAIRMDVEKRTAKALQTLESRAGKVLSQIGLEARKLIEPIARRLPLALKHEVEQFDKRLSSLEKKVDEILRAKPRAS